MQSCKSVPLIIKEQSQVLRANFYESSGVRTAQDINDGYELKIASFFAASPYAPPYWPEQNECTD